MEKNASSCTRSGASEQSALVNSVQSNDSMITAKPEHSVPKKPENEVSSLIQGDFNKKEIDKKNEKLKLPMQEKHITAESTNEVPLFGQCANSKLKYDEDLKNCCITEGSVLKPHQEQATPVVSNRSISNNGGGDTFGEDENGGELREQSTNTTQSQKPTKPVSINISIPIEEDHLEANVLELNAKIKLNSLSLYNISLVSSGLLIV